jgi:regulator of cell morphogenesis and NO signaling
MSTTTQPTVRDMASRSLTAVRVFESLGIDYCCGGERPLEEACRAKGLDATSVRARIESAAVQQDVAEVDWSQVTLRRLAQHIVERHHTYLRAELPRIDERLVKVLSKDKYAQDAPMLAEVSETFSALRAELEMHLMKEERVLFPFVLQYEDAANGDGPMPQPPFGTLDHPIAMMEYEHQSAGDALRRLRAATNGYQVPEYACPTYRALIEGLADLERDLHMHIHLENNLLFPRAVALEARLTRRG